MFEGLQNFQLKHVKKDEKEEKKDDKLNVQEDSIQTDIWFSTNMELWYNCIADYTFPTVFTPLTPEISKAICNSFKLYTEKKSFDRTLLSSEDQNYISALENSIAESIKQLGCTETGVFVKLSCRSPKDATVFGEKMENYYFQSLKKYDQDKIDDNIKLISLYEAHLHALKVNTAKEGLELFTQSDRICQDLTLAIEDFNKKKSDFNIQLIVRKWVDIPISSEFRGFVKNNRLTALSQYYDVCYFPELVQNKDSIEREVKDVFENHIKPKVTFTDSYIVDFCKTEQGKVMVIELNPFHENTDPGMFKWKQDKDILEGKKRIRI